LLDLLFRRVEFHRDDHGSISSKTKNPLFRVGCFYYPVLLKPTPLAPIQALNQYQNRNEL
jgi:hypothetical protein